MAERYEAVYRQVLAESLTEQLGSAIAGLDGRLTTRDLIGRDGRHLLLTARVLRNGKPQHALDEKGQASLDWYDDDRHLGDGHVAERQGIAALNEQGIDRDRPAAD
jgi:hypothetical protein